MILFSYGSGTYKIIGSFFRPGYLIYWPTYKKVKPFDLLSGARQAALYFFWLSRQILANQNIMLPNCIILCLILHLLGLNAYFCSQWNKLESIEIWVNAVHFFGNRKKHLRNLSHFENENTFPKRTTFWKWKLIPKLILKMRTFFCSF